MNERDWTEYPFWKYLAEVLTWSIPILAGIVFALAYTWWTQ